MNFQTKKKLKVVAFVVLVIVAVGAILFFTVPAVKDKILDAWDWLKGLFAKKKD